MAGGEPPAQPPGPPAKGALAEAVGSMWSALVLGLLAAIFAWLWFGGCGESEDRGAAEVPAEGQPVQRECVEQPEETPGEPGAEAAPENILEIGETVPCNTNASLLSNDQEAVKKPELPQTETCVLHDPYHKGIANKGPSKKIDTEEESVIYQPESSELLELETVSCAAEEAHPIVQEIVLDVCPTGESAQSHMQEAELGPKAESVQATLLVVSSKSSPTQSIAQEAVLNLPTAESVQDAVLDFLPAAELVQEEVLDLLAAESVQDAELDVPPKAELVQEEALDLLTAEYVQKVVLDVLPTAASAQSIAQEDVLDVFPTAEWVQEAAPDIIPTVELVQFIVQEAVPSVPTEEYLQEAVLDVSVTDESVQKVVLEVLSTATSAQSGGEGTVLDVFPTAELLQEAVPDVLPTDESAKSSGQDAVLDVFPTAESAQPIEQEAVHDRPMAESMQDAVLDMRESFLDGFPTAESAWCSESTQDVCTDKAEKQSSVQEGVHVSSTSDATQSRRIQQEAIIDTFSTSGPTPSSLEEAVLDVFLTAEAVKPSVQEAFPVAEEAQSFVQENELNVVEHRNICFENIPDVRELSTQKLCTEVDFVGPELNNFEPFQDAHTQNNGDSANSFVDEKLLGFQSSDTSSEKIEPVYITEPQPKSSEGDSKARKIAAVMPMPQNVNMKFRVHYITHSDSQLIAVIGSHESLGKWDVYVPLKPDKDGFWSDFVSLPVDTSVEWKFVMVENGKIKRWEECNNRCLKTGHDDAEAHQWWGYL